MEELTEETPLAVVNDDIHHMFAHDINFFSFETHIRNIMFTMLEPLSAKYQFTIILKLISL